MSAHAFPNEPRCPEQSLFAYKKLSLDIAQTFSSRSSSLGASGKYRNEAHRMYKASEAQEEYPERDRRRNAWFCFSTKKNIETLMETNYWVKTLVPFLVPPVLDTR